MFIFRVIEKMGINTLLGSGWIQYITTVVIVIVGASIFAVVMQHVFKYVSNKLVSR